ncbi:hypothetical protein GQ568_01730, partial [Patescibacteria group bacterium]|nr:hypothetical protein [Patescibacteria group bacterium]
MNSDFRKTKNSENGAANSQSSSFQSAQGKIIKQIKAEIEKKLEPELKEKIESEIEKKAKEKGIDKILPARESKEDQVNKIKKEAAYKAQKLSEKERMSYSPLRSGTGKLHNNNLSEQE